jgi:hypothetical protein
MNAADSINPKELDLVRRLAIAAGIVFLFTAAFAKLERTYSQKFHDVTGTAKWIWAPHRMSDDFPLAFFATRNFDLPERRAYTHLKILGEPEYTIWVNGRQIGARNVGEQRSLDVYDISQLVKTGMNRIVVGVRAPRGVGGLIASIDIGPEAGNWVVTDHSWMVYRVWMPELLRVDVPAKGQPPVVVGEPPIGRWNYLKLADQSIAEPLTNALKPREEFAQIGYIPTIETRSGVAVAGTARARATAFDFGPGTKGRLRITMAEPNRGPSQILNVRFANEREELALAEWGLRPIVIATGEQQFVTPEEHYFRYVMVFGRKKVNVEVLR